MTNEALSFETQLTKCQTKALDIAAKVLDDFGFHIAHCRELTNPSAPLGIMAIKLMGLTPVDAPPPADYAPPAGQKYRFPHERILAFQQIEQCCSRKCRNKISALLDKIELEILNYKRYSNELVAA